MADAPGSRGSQGAALSRPTLVYMLRRVLAEFTRDGGTDQAAKLTYFMVLAVAPTLLALFSLATLLLRGVQDRIADLLTGAITSGLGDSDQGIREIVTSTVDSLVGSTTGGTVALVIGVGTALWSASAYVKAFGRVANQIYEVPEGRGIVRLSASMLALTAVLILGILVVLVSVLLNETLVEGVLGPLASGLGLTGLLTFLTDTFLPVWAWVKWPVILVLAFALVSLLYWGAPNLRKPYRFISPGGVVAVIGIALAAVAVSVYMATVAGYSSYGAIGGVMAVLFALWIMNIVIIVGAEVDAEFERARELEAGRPAEDGLALPLRDDTAAEKADAKREALIDEGRDIRLRHLHRDGDAHTGAAHRPGPSTPTSTTTDTASDADTVSDTRDR